MLNVERLLDLVVKADILDTSLVGNSQFLNFTHTKGFGRMQTQADYCTSKLAKAEPELLQGSAVLNGDV